MWKISTVKINVIDIYLVFKIYSLVDHVFDMIDAAISLF